MNSEFGNAHTQPRGLFDLPQELILCILEMTVTRSSVERPIRAYCQIGKTRYTSAGQPPVTRTCRFLRELGVPIFYQKNVFEISFSSGHRLHAQTWLTRVGEDNAKHIDKLLVTRPRQRPLHGWMTWREIKGLRDALNFTPAFAPALRVVDDSIAIGFGPQSGTTCWQVALKDPSALRSPSMWSDWRPIGVPSAAVMPGDLVKLVEWEDDSRNGHPALEDCDSDFAERCRQTKMLSLNARAR